MPVEQLETQQPPTHCPTCNVELAVDFACGNYVVFKCEKCGLNIRSFPPEPLTAFYEDPDRSVDINALLAAAISRRPQKIVIPDIDLDSLISDLD